MPELSPEQKNAISWTICCTNAFVMLTSGLVIDIKKVWENLHHRKGFKSGILIGKQIIYFSKFQSYSKTSRQLQKLQVSYCTCNLYDGVLFC